MYTAFCVFCVSVGGHLLTGSHPGFEHRPSQACECCLVLSALKYYSNPATNKMAIAQPYKEPASSCRAQAPPHATAALDRIMVAEPLFLPQPTISCHPSPVTPHEVKHAQPRASGVLDDLVDGLADIGAVRAHDKLHGHAACGVDPERQPHERLPRHRAALTPGSSSAISCLNSGTQYITCVPRPQSAAMGSEEKHPSAVVFQDARYAQTAWPS